MKKLILLLFLTPLFLHAEEGLKRVPEIYKSDSQVDQELKADQSKYTFKFNAYGEYPIPMSVQYSIDGKNGKQQLKNGSISIDAKPGKHIFQFFYSQNYTEVYSDSLEIQGQYHDTYQIQLYASQRMEVSEKPVIYLYPEKSTEVSVKMDIHGENAFYYPAYKDSWNFTAAPNGDLTFGDDIYNYLFWEATNRTILSPKQTASGFFVEGENIVSFLEDKLTQAGLNSKEQADFITYWGPRLSQNKLNFIHFEFNENCNEYANIDITPKPDNMYRIYMIWGAVTEEFKVTEQEIPLFDRDGFSGLEWGGKESHIRQSFVNQNQ